jgi:phosphoadenosine phosphosulfate reductase
MPGPVYLGRIQLNWCRACNLPILEESLCTCGGPTQRVPLTPPGDAYPAVEVVLEELRSEIDQAFGSGAGAGLLPMDKVILLTIIPAQDRAVEVILDGSVLGRRFYEATRSRWIFKPAIEGARRLSAVACRGRVSVDPGAYVALLKGASLLAPGVVGADPGISPGDEILIEDEEGKVFAVGSARMAGQEMLESNRGLAAKVREAQPYSEPDILPGGQTWGEMLEANEGVLARREREAIDFICRISESKKLPVSVAFSGGKDSLCTLLLVAKALEEFAIIFIDTGIEFPETVAYTREVIEELGMSDRLIVREVGDRFWDAMKVFGPPSRDARWCCKVCKLGPTTAVIQENFGGRCLTFVGQRKYESQQRLSRGRITRNPWVPGQTSASPIRDWTALHVWLYILREGAPMNPLYQEGYARIGCSVCPASELAELDLLSETHPDVHARLVREVSRHGKAMGLSDRWFELGLWRWRRPPAWSGEEPVHDPFEYIEPNRFVEQVGEDGLSLRTALEPGTDRRRVVNALRALGEVEMVDGGFRLSTKGMEIRGDDVQVTVGPGKDGLARETARRLASCLVKARYCVGCGTCVGSCYRGAIRIEDDRAWIGEGCTGCGSCIDLCPLLTWAVSEAARPFG